MDNSNMRFYTPGAKVPKEACREFNNGRFRGTDINRMWRTRVITEMFGPVGFGWTFNLTEISERKLENSDATVIFAKGELKVRDPETKEWSEPIIGYGGNFIIQSFSSGSRVNDEAYKMVETDAFGSACSKLGIGESVYWNEATKYTQQTEEPKATATSTATAVPRAPEIPKTKQVRIEVEPNDKEMIAAIYAVKDPKIKKAINEYMTGHNIMSPYETTPEQRKALYTIAKREAKQ